MNDLIERIHRYRDALQTGDPDRQMVNPDDDLKLLDDILKALAKVEELENAPVAYGLANDVDILRAKVEELEKFVELVEGALGCTDGDDIRTHIEPELAALKQEVSDLTPRK